MNVNDVLFLGGPDCPRREVISKIDGMDINVPIFWPVRWKDDTTLDRLAVQHDVYRVYPLSVNLTKPMKTSYWMAVYRGRR